MSILKDIIKWSVILVIAAVLFYVVFPKYKFMGPKGLPLYRCNSVTGEVEAWHLSKKTWTSPEEANDRLIRSFAF